MTPTVEHERDNALRDLIDAARPNRLTEDRARAIREAEQRLAAVELSRLQDRVQQLEQAREQ